MRTYQVATRVGELLVLLGFGLCMMTLVGCGGGGGKRVAVEAGPLVLALPVGHGLSPGEFTVPAGTSEEQGQVVISCPAGGPDCVFTVTDDRSASYPRTGGMPTFRIADLRPGPGLSISDAAPVVASNDADTLQELRDNPDNAFPTLSATLYRAFPATTSESGRSELSNGFAVNSIQVTAAGEYIVHYYLDGTPGSLTITENERRNDVQYRIRVDGTTYWFWFKTDHDDDNFRNRDFSQYMDSAFLSRSTVPGQHRAWFIFGARTDTLPSTGRATYLGRLEGRAYKADDHDNSVRQHITGAMRLVANFDLNEVNGKIDAIRKHLGTLSGAAADWRTSSFEITDGRIVNGQFTATLTGKDTDPDASFDESLKDFTGWILGEFYGPNANEVGAVVSAERAGDGPESHGRNLYGYVVGKNIEDFREEAARVGLEPLSGQAYGNGGKALIVMLHGTVSRSLGPSDYMYHRAREIAQRMPDATVVAVLAPGYYDQEGRVSPGSNHERRDFNTPENNDLLAMTIQNLKRKLSPEHVIAVGHSAGARELGVILGRYDGLVDGVVLAGGRYRQGSRILSEIPLDVIDGFDSSVKVVALTGTHDTDVSPEESQNYVKRLKELGVDARLSLVKGEGHSWRDELNDAAVQAVGRILNELEPGLGEALVSDSPMALVTGVYRDEGDENIEGDENTRLFADVERPTVESTDNGFRITYVVDGQRRTVDLDGEDFVVDRRHYRKETDDGTFRVDVFDNEYRYLDIGNWSFDWPLSSSTTFGQIIYGRRTEDMPTTGMASYAGRMRAREWPTDAAVRSGHESVTDLRGELTLTADFANSSVRGEIARLQTRPGDRSRDYEAASGRLRFNGMIDGSSISAHNLAGSEILAQYSNGEVIGAFFGPEAAEVGGVFEADSATGNRLLNGYFAGTKE